MFVCLSCCPLVVFLHGIDSPLGVWFFSLGTIPVFRNHLDHLIVIHPHFSLGQHIQNHLDQIVNVWFGDLWDSGCCVSFAVQSLWSLMAEGDRQFDWACHLFFSRLNGIQHGLLIFPALIWCICTESAHSWSSQCYWVCMECSLTVKYPHHPFNLCSVAIWSDHRWNNV